MTHFVFTPAPVVQIPVVGTEAQFPVRRIYCVARNYEEHAREMGHTDREPPFFFMKPADAVVVCLPGQTTPLPYPSLTGNLHHEVELVVAIGTGGKNIPGDQALQHIFGYAVGLDMTRRDLQNDMKKQGRPWCIAKGFDHSAPIGLITPTAAVPGIHAAEIDLSVNGTPRQHGQTDQLIWRVAETIAQLSTAWELQPGDLIYTGTPAGVGAVTQGDVLHGTITGLSPICCQVV
ncbi:fumarylacetoacetate hydrolase family protein [Rhodoferax sp. U2-2l]|uniref:fumarylacetoacetate hydrolase family protein n=1 Tax=Rhodoferax sp. U2-2l TaxID=2884000 RepID=UPI001D0A707B|nr:fumarylacetoacetate hydrolase family protein [Rhodoferax sp. U2-2l]MCB8746430.1 fumarylacetoacetate hydrolase family protein [Rhodoferax sp. U2-2l]